MVSQEKTLRKVCHVLKKLFEARTPKRKAIMSEVSGSVELEKSERSLEQAGTGKQIIDATPGQRVVRVQFTAADEKVHTIGRGGKIQVEDGVKVKEGELLALKADGERIVAEHAGITKVTKTAVAVMHDAEKIREYIIPQGYTLYVKDGDVVKAGDVLTDGHLDLQALYKFQGKDAVQKYLSKEIQYIYSSQGQKLNNKHIEIIVKQMFSRVRISDPGDTDMLPGELCRAGNIARRTGQGACKRRAACRLRGNVPRYHQGVVVDGKLVVECVVPRDGKGAHQRRSQR